MQVFKGFWKWLDEMEALQLFPEMDEVFQDRMLESRDAVQDRVDTQQKMRDEMDAFLKPIEKLTKEKSK